MVLVVTRTLICKCLDEKYNILLGKRRQRKFNDESSVGMSSRKLYSKTSTESAVYIAQHVSQIAKQMDAALQGLNKSPRH